MKIQSSLYYLGLSCFPVCILSLFNIFYSYYFDYLLDVNSYIIVLFLSFLIGSFLCFIGKTKKEDIDIYSQLILIFLIYLLISILISIPFHLSIYQLSLIDSFFESVSGFSNTGFSVISDIKNLDPPLILWRSSSQWLGGFYFLVFLVLIFSNKNINFKMIDFAFNFEKKTNFSKNILNVSYRIFFIYLTLTLIIFLLFIFSDVRIFNSLNLSMTIISSGGFLPTNMLGDILKTNLHYIVLILSFLISIFNFYILYNLFFDRNNLKNHGEDLYIFILSLSFCLLFYLITDLNLLEVFISVLSSIGNSGLEITSIPNNYSLFLLLLTLFGGSALSVTSGIKFIRVYILIKAFFLEIYRLVKPNVILNSKIMLSENRISKDNVGIAFLVFILFFLSLFILSSILLLDSFGFESSFKLSLLTLTNTRASSIYGLDSIDFANLFVFSKISLIFFMIIAKIELLAIFLIVRKFFFSN